MKWLLDYLDQTVDFFSRLETMKAFPMTVIICVLAGYAMKMIKRINNDRIPERLCYSGPFIMLGLSANNWPNSAAPMVASFVVRQLLLGLFAALIALFMHKFLLKPAMAFVFEKLNLKKDADGTDQFIKDPPASEPMSRAPKPGPPVGSTE